MALVIAPRRRIFLSSGIYKNFTVHICQEHTVLGRTVSISAHPTIVFLLIILQLGVAWTTDCQRYYFTWVILAVNSNPCPFGNRDGDFQIAIWPESSNMVHCSLLMHVDRQPHAQCGATVGSQNAPLHKKKIPVMYSIRSESLTKRNKTAAYIT